MKAWKSCDHRLTRAMANWIWVACYRAYRWYCLVRSTWCRALRTICKLWKLDRENRRPLLQYRTTATVGIESLLHPCLFAWDEHISTIEVICLRLTPPYLGTSTPRAPFKRCNSSSFLRSFLNNEAKTWLPNTLARRYLSCLLITPTDAATCPVIVFVSITWFNIRTWAKSPTGILLRC